MFNNLIFQDIDIKIKKQKDKIYVFDILRNKYVRLTPEELVRQYFVLYLTSHKKYPKTLLANEISIRQGKVVRRCDTILYDRLLRPKMIFEYKAPFISLNLSCFKQILYYNSTLKVPWIVLSNGLIHYCCHITTNGKYSFLKEIPNYYNL